MYEFDILPIGDGERSGDAIAARFTDPATNQPAHVVVDAGFQPSGEALVSLIQDRYGTDRVDLAILTHPDGDHIGGMGEVVRGLDVGVLCLHRLGQRGGAGLEAADAVDDLIATAEGAGTKIHEPWPGDQAFGGTLTFLGPGLDYYEALVVEQQQEELAKEAGAPTIRRPAPRVLEAALAKAQQFVAQLPVEIPFGDSGGTSPRNNTSIITLFQLDNRRIVLAGDAGVDAMEQALAFADASGLAARSPDRVVIPHHGSRRNGSSNFLDAFLGPHDQAQDRIAIVSAAAKAPKHPSPRIVNAFKRRGYGVGQTKGVSVWLHSDDAPPRPDYGPLPMLDAMNEALELEEDGA